MKPTNLHMCVLEAPYGKCVMTKRRTSVGLTNNLTTTQTVAMT